MKGLVPAFIAKRNAEAKPSGSIKAGVLFADLAGFTSMSDALMKQGKEGAGILSEIINFVFGNLVSIIEDHGGFISGFAGDAFTAIFAGKSEEQVFKASNLIHTFITKESVQKTKTNTFTLGIKIGVACGKVQWGLSGDENLKTWYFRGMAIDESAAAEALATPGETIWHESASDILDELQASKQEIQKHYFKIKNPEQLAINSIEFIKNKVEVREIDVSMFAQVQNVPERAVGEFREIVSVFISLKSNLSEVELEDNVSLILRESKNYGGYFSGLDSGDKGNNILVLFGAPVSYEDNYERASNFILHIKKNLAEDFRAGISSGQAFAGFIGAESRRAYSALGNVINRSARLMMQAKFGQIMAAGSIIAKLEKNYIFQDLGYFKMKGFVKKIKIWDLIETKDKIQRGSHYTPLFGRNEQYAKLSKILEPIYEGRVAKTTYVLGDAGIGKSRLLFEYATSFEEKINLFVLQTDAILKKSMFSFTNFFQEHFQIPARLADEVKVTTYREKIQHFVKEVKKKNNSDEILQRINELKRTESLIAAMIGVHSAVSVYNEMDAQSRFENTISAIKNYFILQSILKPLLIVVEDAHWLDVDSASVLKSITHNINDIPIALVLASRFSDDGSEPELLGGGEVAEIEIEKIILNPLQVVASKQFINSVLEAKADSALTQRIISKSQNNPFFSEQICIYLLENNALKKQGSVIKLASENIEIPISISSILTSRIDRLSPELKQAVLTASALGREFDIRVLVQLLEDADFLSILDMGKAEQIWEESSEHEFVFNHGLLRDAAYAMQLKSNLKKLHKNIAVSIENIFPGMDTHFADLAYHYEKAENALKAKEFYAKSVAYAQENFKNSKALEFLYKLKVYSENEVEEFEIIEKECKILEITGKWDEVTTKLETVLVVVKSGSYNNWQAIFLTSLAEIHQKRGKYLDAEKVLLSAIDIAKSNGFNNILSTSYLQLGRIKWSLGLFEQSIENIEQSLNIKKELKDTQGEGLALYYLGVTYRDKGDYTQAMHFYEKSLELFTQLNHKRYISYPMYDIGVLYQYRGQLEKSMHYFKQTQKIYGEIGYQSGLSATLLNLGAIEALRGNYDKSLSLYYQSLAIAEEVGEQLAISYTLFSMSSIYYKQSDYDNAVEFSQKALEMMVSLGAVGYYGYVLSYLACSYVKLEKIKLTIKTIYFHVKNIKLTGADVENGRSLMALAMALSSAKPLNEKSKAMLKVITRHFKVALDVDSIFQEAIRLSEKNNYVNTIAPSYLNYARYLIKSQRLDEAKTILEKGVKIAKKSGMIRFLEYFNTHLKELN